jgi:hypothetical protein
VGLYPAAVKSPLVAALVFGAAVLAACTASTPTLTTAPPGAPSTTIAGDTCDRLVDDTTRYFELVIEVLDDTALDDFRDRDRWPEALLALEQQGEDLDTRSRVMRCDPAVVQERVFSDARLRPDSGLARFLLELLGLE